MPDGLIASLAALALSLATFLIPARPLAAAFGRGRALSWRNRIAAAALVASVQLGLRALLPDAGERAALSTCAVITLGYGHLIGGAASAAQHAVREPRPDGSSGLALAFVAVSALTLLAAYTWLVGLYAPIAIALLAVATWHAVENDLMLARAYADRLRIPPLSRTLRPNALAIGFAALVAALAAFASTRVDAAHWVSLADVFAVTTLYHLLSWLVFLADRARTADEPDARRRNARRLGRRLAWTHLPPAFACVGLLCGSAEALAPLRAAVFSPALYLFWSLLHVVQTAWARGVEPPRSR